MFELTMTAFSDYQVPAIIFKQPEDVAHLHHGRILSHIKSEINNIAFLHDVVLALES